MSDTTKKTSDVAVDPMHRQVRTRTQELEEVRATVAHLNADVRQLGRGPIQGELDVVQLGPVTLNQISINRALHAHGHIPNVYGFGIVTKANSGLRLQRRVALPGQINVITPSGKWDHIAPAGLTRHLALTVDADELERSAEVLHQVDLRKHLANVRLMTPAPKAFQALRSLISGALAQLKSGATTPEHLRAAGFPQKCIEKLLLALLPASSVAEGPRREVSCRGIVRRAEEYMAARLGERLTLPDLCREVQVSERTLRASFVSMFGLSPMNVFKTWKLNAVRRALVEAAPGSGSVHQIVGRWGFIHTGNFAHDYRRLFGELPSETLSRSNR